MSGIGLMDALMAPSQPRTSIKLPEDVVNSARIVSALRGIPMQDLMAEILRPALAKMERESLSDRARELDKPPAPKRKAKGGGE